LSIQRFMQTKERTPRWVDAFVERQTDRQTDRNKKKERKLVTSVAFSEQLA